MTTVVSTGTPTPGTHTTQITLPAVNKQAFFSIVRQVLAYAGIAMGILTQAVSGIHLPVVISSAITIGGAVLINVEHYVADPSTGTPPA